jgi:gamma-D-glutamyl-L-lysine dipeptidyl-peptidase
MSHKLAYCVVSISPIRAEASDRAEMVSQLLFGEIVQIEEIKSPWCKINSYMDNYSGYIDLKHVHFLSEKEVNRWLDGIGLLTDLQCRIKTPWGEQRLVKGSHIPFEFTPEFTIGNHQFQFIDEPVQHRSSDPYEQALIYINTPYLWGGKSPFGIDCSGLTQMVFRFHEINLPRDASQQVDYGQLIDFEDLERGDLAFFANADGRIIHVGICGDKDSIIHASGWVRIDRLNSDGIIHSETGLQTHQLHSIKRM